MHTDKGSIESLNADLVSNWAIENGQAYMVCDGIKHTEETLEAVNKFAAKLQQENWCYSHEMDKKLSVNVLAALESMSPEYNGIAFCCCIALVFNGHLVIGFCGDCRIGGLSSKNIQWLTQDDVPFLKMYQSGEVTFDFYIKARHLLACKLKVGENNKGRLKITSYNLSDFENLLLCSDGFWSEVKWLEQATSDNFAKKVESELERLTNTAIDNYSVIVL